MDKSKQYIQMCKRSKEIQSAWRPKAGDFYADMNNSVVCWFPDPTRSPVIKNGFGIKAGEKVTTLSPLTWMPKLDQLMEEAQILGSGFRQVSFVFYEWVKLPYGDSEIAASKFFASLEQVWLAFIMNKKFIKVWRDDDWLPFFQ